MKNLSQEDQIDEAIEAFKRLKKRSNLVKDESFKEQLKKKPEEIFATPKRGPKPRFDMNPLGRAILDYVADGEWHDVEELINKLHPLVPPGVGWRFAEGRRILARKKRGQEAAERERPVSQEAITMSGQRGLARKCLAEMARPRPGHPTFKPRLEVIWKDPASSRKRMLKVRLNQNR